MEWKTLVIAVTCILVDLINKTGYYLIMTTNMIISLILAMAPVFNVDPHIALAVASVESNLNPHAIGGHGEVGLFQVMPAQFKSRGYTKKQMEQPLNNIYVGLQMIAEARKSCVHKGAIHSLVCYNAGPTVAKRIKNPSKFSYVKKITKKLLTILSTGK